VVGDLLEVFLSEDLGFGPRYLDGFFEQEGYVGLTPDWPDDPESTQLFQLLGNSQRPWMKTTGVLPEALAATTCLYSRSEIDAMLYLSSVDETRAPSQRGRERAPEATT
jgi:hypothetical protein